MKLTLQLALLFFVFAGITSAAYSDPLPFNVNTGWSSMSAWDGAYSQNECQGVHDLFVEHPIPIGAIDEENGREIIGWEIICDDGIIMDVGSTNTPPPDNRVVPRGSGWIRLHYAPAPR
jgi:hypothetical protein